MSTTLANDIKQSIKTLEQNCADFDNTLEQVENKRKKILDKIEIEVEKMLEDISSETNAKLLDAKSSLINSYLTGLTHSENNVKQRVLVNIKRKELDVSSNVGEMVIEVLKGINSKPKNNNNNSSSIMRDKITILENVIKDKDIVVNENEIKDDKASSEEIDNYLSRV